MGNNLRLAEMHECYPITVAGLKIPVYVDKLGLFIANIGDDDSVNALKYADLQEKIEQAIQTRSKNVAVPFCTFIPRQGIKKGIIRGIHAGSRDFLVTWEDGTKDTVSKLTTFYELPSEEVVKRIEEIVAQRELLLKEVTALAPVERDTNFIVKLVLKALAE